MQFKNDLVTSPCYPPGVPLVARGVSVCVSVCVCQSVVSVTGSACLMMTYELSVL